MYDPLDVPASTFNLGTHLKFPHIYGINTFYSGLALFDEVRSHEEVWAITYTYDAEFGNLLPLTRVIYCKLNGEPKKKIDYRLANNIHTKLYICFARKRLSTAFCGSCNIVNPTFLELATRLRKSDLTDIQDYFIQLWNQIEPKK